MIFDTHTHIYLQEFDNDRAEVMERASQAGVSRMMLPNVDTKTIYDLKQTLSAYPCCIAAMGLHPTSVNDDYREALNTVCLELESGIYRAVGEVGVDLYWDATFRSQQITVFEEQLNFAKEKNLPVIVHSRNAFSDTIDSLKRVGWKKIILHSFGGSAGEVREACRCCDPWFGINGVITFKNSDLADTVREIGLSRLLIETDAPYLAPVPYRGKRNEPSYITNTISRVAEILSVTPDIVAETTYKNASTLFGVK